MHIRVAATENQACCAAILQPAFQKQRELTDLSRKKARGRFLIKAQEMAIP
jgi:hypothetical protein